MSPENVSIEQSQILIQSEPPVGYQDLSINQLNQFQINEPMQFPQLKRTKFCQNEQTDALEGQTQRRQLFDLQSDVNVRLGDEGDCNEYLEEYIAANSAEQVSHGVSPKIIPIAAADAAATCSKDPILEEPKSQRQKSINIKRSSKSYSQSYSKSLKQFKLSILSGSKQGGNRSKVLPDGGGGGNGVDDGDNDDEKHQRTRKLVWKHSVFKIIGYFNRIVMRFTKILLFRHPERLSRRQFETINDKASNPAICEGAEMEDVRQQLERDARMKQRFGKKNYKKYKILKKSLLRNYRSIQEVSQSMLNFYSTIARLLMHNIPIFDPFSAGYAIWEVFISLIVLIEVIIIPIVIVYESSLGEVGFSQSRYLSLEGLVTTLLFLVSPIVLGVDMLLQANTSFYDKDNPITNHKDILKHYLKYNFVIDLLTLICLIVGSHGGENLWLLVFLLRIFNLKDVVTLVKQQLFVNRGVAAVLQSITICCKALFFAHLLACAWLYLGTREEQTVSGISWLSRSGLHDAEFITKYISALFFACRNEEQIQSQDTIVKAHTNSEKIFVIFQTIVQLYALGYFIKFISGIFQELNINQKEYNKKLDTVNNCLRAHEVSKPLRLRIMKYLEYEYKEGISHKYTISQNIECVSKYLKEEILKEVNLKILKRVRLFKEYFNDESFLQKLAFKMTEQAYGPQQLIVKSNSLEKPCLYIVSKGEVEVFLQMGEGKEGSQSLEDVHSMGKLRQFQVFGQLEFFTQNHTTSMSVRSTCVTTVHRISLEDFLELCAPNSEEREVYCFLKDCLLYNKDYGKIGLCCFSCKESRHTLLECPYFFYGQQKTPVLGRILRDIDKQIYEFKRKSVRKRFGALTKLKDLEEKRYTFVESNIEFLVNNYMQYLTDDSEMDSLSGSSFSQQMQQPMSPYIDDEEYLPENLRSSECDSLQKMVDQEMQLNLNLVTKRVPSIDYSYSGGGGVSGAGGGTGNKMQKNILTVQGPQNRSSNIVDVSDIISLQSERENQSRGSNRSISLNRQQQQQQQHVGSEVKLGQSGIIGGGGSGSIVVLQQEAENPATFQQFRQDSDSLFKKKLEKENSSNMRQDSDTLFKKKLEKENSSNVQQNNSLTFLNQGSVYEGSFQDKVDKMESKGQPSLADDLTQPQQKDLPLIACASSASFGSISHITPPKGGQTKNFASQKKLSSFSDHATNIILEGSNNLGMYNNGGGGGGGGSGKNRTKVLTQTYFDNRMQQYNNPARPFGNSMQPNSYEEEYISLCQIRVFKTYFPKNNIEQVISHYNQNLRQQRSQKRIKSSRGIIRNKQTSINQNQQ